MPAVIALLAAALCQPASPAARAAARNSFASMSLSYGRGDRDGRIGAQPVVGRVARLRDLGGDGKDAVSCCDDCVDIPCRLTGIEAEH